MCSFNANTDTFVDSIYCFTIGYATISFKPCYVFTGTTDIFICPRFREPRLPHFFTLCLLHMVRYVANTNAIRIGFNDIILDSVFIK